MNAYTVLFVGKPGSGKGTQAKLLAEKTGWRVITAGDQFRAMAAEDTPIGRKMKVEMNAGLLLPSWLPTHLFLESIFSVKEEESVIFDGAGRKVPEAELIIDSLRWIGRSFVALHLVVSDEEVHRRLILRKEIEGRADDHSVSERLNEYYAHTDATIKKFREAGNCIDIDGEQTPEQIAARIGTILTLALQHGDEASNDDRHK